MYSEIREYVKGCLICQQDKHVHRHPAGKLMPLPIAVLCRCLRHVLHCLDHPAGKLMPLPLTTHAWEYVTADRIVGLPKTKKGYTAILVVVDRLTKMTHFAPCEDMSTAQEIAQLFVDMVFKHHGMPLRITTDRGPEFTNKFIAALCEIVGGAGGHATALHQA